MNFKPQRRSLVWGAMFAMLILASLITGYFLNWFSPNAPPDIVLPSPPPSGSSETPPQTPSATPPGTPSPTPVHVEVTVDNVRRIVENLSRPDQYQCEWRVEWFWGTGSAAANRRVFVRDGWTKTDIYNPDGSLQRHQITGEGGTFIFAQGFWQPEQGDFNPDNEAALPAAYETITSLDKEDILSAEFLTWEDLPCIYVAFRVADTRYVDAYWLSYNDGLPLQMERSADGVTVVRCVRNSLELVRPGDDEFLLPNNQLAWDA